VRRGPAPCLFTETLEGSTEAIPIPVAHAEGRFTTVDPDVTARLVAGQRVALEYAEPDGSVARGFPANPNGSLAAIAGLTNARGNVLALMPHPERACWLHQVPEALGGRWAERRRNGELFAAGPGRLLFEALARALR